MNNLQIIQKWMKNEFIDVIFINRTDEFLNEYIAKYAERLNWISNFSGSAGKLIIEQEKSYLFVDGRYTEQAKEQVDTKNFKLLHLKEYFNFLKNYKKTKKNIGIDPKLHSIDEIEKIKNLFKKTNITIKFLKKNPIDLHWSNQPAYPNSSIFIHKKKYAGEIAKNKIKKIQKILKLNLIDYYILNSLDSIAWLLNIRGNDILYTPLAFCFVIIPNKGKVELFVRSSKVSLIKKKINPYVKIHPFKKIDQYIINLEKINNIGMDKKQTSFYFKKICEKNNLPIKYLENPCLYFKAQKNKSELLGAKKANLRDGISVTKFLYWLKNETKIKNMDEISAAKYLYDLRRKNILFYSLSFDTISAFGSHASLPHYRVSKKSNIKFKNNGIYLVDSGAQYIDGTTDITRTVVFGKATKEQKDRFTRVLKGHIAIAEAIFSKKTKGSTLDILARRSLKEINCDYDHGTGHGIGSFLGVHEGPQRIAKSQSLKEGFIKQGMILSNEPGYYKKKEYGIRIENLIITTFDKKSKKLKFETISWAPIDRDLIEISLLSRKEIKWINKYHKKVYKIISPNLNKDQKEWLFLVTLPL